MSAEAHIDERSGAKEAFIKFINDKGRFISLSNPYVIHDLLEQQNIPTGYRLK